MESNIFLSVCLHIHKHMLLLKQHLAIKVVLPVDCDRELTLYASSLFFLEGKELTSNTSNIGERIE